LEYIHPDDRYRVAGILTYIVENPGKIVTIEKIKAIGNDGRVIYPDDYSLVPAQP